MKKKTYADYTKIGFDHQFIMLLNETLLEA